MQKIIFYTVIMFISFVGKTFAQEKTFEERAKEIGNQIEIITIEEKKALRSEIEAIDNQIIDGKITKERADELKFKIAKERASNIETKVAIEEEKLNQLIQDKVDGKVKHATDTTSVRIGKRLVLKYENDTIQKKNKDYNELRTTTQLVVASGFNNLITNGQVANSDFGYLRSTFFEWGISLRTNIIKDKRLLNFKYGVSFMYNNLTATDDRYFVDNGDQTILQTSPINLSDKESYFKNVYVTVPLHLELDFSKPKTRNDKTYYVSHTGFRIGIGGYGGYNINSKQFLEYKVDNYEFKERQKGDWNVTDWNYGLSTYVGYGRTSLYLKYDLNPLFKDNTVDQNNISLGLRFDLN